MELNSIAAEAKNTKSLITNLDVDGFMNILWTSDEYSSLMLLCYFWQNSLFLFFFHSSFQGAFLSFGAHTYIKLLCFSFSDGVFLIREFVFHNFFFRCRCRRFTIHLIFHSFVMMKTMKKSSCERKKNFKFLIMSTFNTFPLFFFMFFYCTQILGWRFEHEMQTNRKSFLEKPSEG